MDKTPHVMLTGDGADKFAIELGIKTVEQDYFKTDSQTESWNRWKARQAARSNKISKEDYAKGDDRLFYLGTVGCVVRDQSGNLAAATSTGGLLGKKYGRVGDSPVMAQELMRTIKLVQLVAPERVNCSFDTTSPQQFPHEWNS